MSNELEYDIMDKLDSKAVVYITGLIMEALAEDGIEDYASVGFQLDAYYTPENNCNEENDDD